MRLVTLVSLGASAVLGLGALFIARSALPTPQATAMPAPAPMAGAVPVVVASRPIGFGAKLDASYLTIAKAPKSAVPEGAFSTIEQVLAQDGGGAPVALTPIAARETLLPSKLSGPGARASVAAEIEAGHRAYTIKVTDVSGVGGHALPGDRVDVVMSRDMTPTGDTRNYVSEVVLQNVRVLGVDLNADLTSNKPATPNTATLEVSVKDAQKLAVAADLGALSLALRPSGAADVETVAPVATRDFAFAAARPAPGPRRAQGPKAPAGPPPRRMIIIVEGDSAPAKTDAPAAAAKPAGV
jgi:pilus assembly protein CpaB